MVLAPRIDAPLALVALAVCPLLFWSFRTSTGAASGPWRESRTLETSALSVVQEALAAIRVVKAFGQEDREEQRFVRQSGHAVFAPARVAAAEGSFTLLVGLATAIGTAAVLLIGASHVQCGQLYARQPAHRHGVPLSALRAAADHEHEDRGPAVVVGQCRARVRAPRRAPRRRGAPRTRARSARGRGAVEFRDVSFAYECRATRSRDVFVTIEPGTRFGSSGTTGAGKTTLVSLLTRFYDPQAGAILLDGVDIRDYRLADLRNQFAIVLQEPVLFSTTIAENIAYGRPDGLARGDRRRRARRRRPRFHPALPTATTLSWASAA